MREGEHLASFRLPASTGQTLERDSFLGKVPLVIFFLPGVDDDVDRDQILSYDSLLKEFGTERSQALGVTKETARTLRDLADDLGLGVPLLADAAGEMARQFDVDDPDGRPRRVTFLADKEGVVVRRIDPAPPDGQAASMLAAVKELAQGEIGAPRRDQLEEPPG